MRTNCFQVRCRIRCLLFAILVCSGLVIHAQNDACSSASPVVISGGGFGVGSFTSATIDISPATVEPGETFAPAIFGAGQSQKSIWYKFTIPTTRAVRVSLAQVGSGIASTDIGFAVYKTQSCLPNATTQISNQLTPINTFGNTYHECTPPGEYLVQVSSKASASGQVYITVETALPSAAYDQPANAYNFGTLQAGLNTIGYAVKCQSVENAAENCPVLYNSSKYNKSTWHVFKTPAYFDYIVLFLDDQAAPNSEKFGFRLYEGDVRSTSYTTLPVVRGCDSIQTNSYYAAKSLFKCGELNTGSTYSIQIFYHEDFEDNVNLGIGVVGTTPTKAPEPILSGIPAPSNSLGVLPSGTGGVNTSMSDYLACNSRLSTHPCLPSLPAGGVTYGSLNYNLSTFFRFKLNTTSRIVLYSTPGNGSPALLHRLYRQDVGSNCASLDPANMVAQFVGSYFDGLACMPPGDYTLQVLGRDTLGYYWDYTAYSSLYTHPYQYPYLSNLGQKVDLMMTVYTQPTQNKFSLATAGAFDAINAVNGQMQPLVNGTSYTSNADTLACGNTVLPPDSCGSGQTKVSYRQFIIGDSTMMTITNGSALSWKIYQGDADALANAQNLRNFPGRIQGLDPITLCRNYNDCSGTKVCLEPGVYTHVTLGTDQQIGQSSQPTFTVNNTTTVHASPATAENLGDILALVTPGNSLSSSVDYFSCKDNAVPINGYQPCSINGAVAKKAIYRQFYLSATASVNINNYYTNPSCPYYWYNTNAVFTVFSGKATDGLAGLTPLPAPWRCTQNVYALNSCIILEAGWYTIVSYGVGPSYQEPMRDLNLGTPGYASSVGWTDRITIGVNAMCPGPKYNRPHRAAVDAVTGLPFKLEWAPRVGHTSAYPKTDTTYVLPTENFNCIVDTPFSLHPITACDPALTKVAYYVFQTTQESYIQIDTKGFYGAVYAGNVRTDSASFATTQPIQTCNYSNLQIQLCRLQPGYYTLVIFANSTQNCHNVEPTIYIDRTGVAKYDHANKAYDFGMVPPDSVFHYGKLNEVNPDDPGRKPSSDFFYCNTGAQSSDPTDGICYLDVNPRVYNPSQVNNALFPSPSGWGISRRNLWYTFVVKEGGNVRVRVESKTPGKPYNYVYTVFKSNVDGSLPFSQVVSSGAVDSTIAQGLTQVVSNNGCHYQGPVEISFLRPSCSPVPERYYIMIDVPNTYYYGGTIHGMKPATQVDVAVMVDSIQTILPKFDHYYQAGNIGTNLGEGEYSGETDNYSCATRDLNDPVYSYSHCATKTLWYKFTTTVTGNIQYRVMVNNVSNYYDQIQLFRQTIPGDSTSNGLQIQNNSFSYVYDQPTAAYWMQTCITPGTYYIILSGCYKVNEYATPQIRIIEQKGDFCTAPVVASLGGAGTSQTSVIVNCHTIGTDYGEFNNTLTCPAGAPRGNYKTSWFRVDITGTDTLDLTTYLTENTNASSSDIKYRMMDGNCGAMQERSCVQDALTHDTYKCLPPGRSYYFQVFTPVTKNGAVVTGDIKLNLSAVVHADTCAPINPCLSTAVFIPQFDCTLNDTVTFVNYSTYGTDVQYQWDFGYNGQTSTAISPQFKYPALATDQTYTATLTVSNAGCTGAGGQSTYSVPVFIPGRPDVQLGRDTSLCTLGSSITLNAATWPGATYLWSTGATTPTITAASAGNSTYHVMVSYNNCIRRDTIKVNINSVLPTKQTKYICETENVQLQSSYHYYGQSHLWSTGSTSPYISVNTPGTYTDINNWYGCIIMDTFRVVAAKAPFASADTMICQPFQSFVLNASTPEGQSYSWQNGANGPGLTVNVPGVYWVQVWNGQCYKRDTIQVKTSAAVVKDTTLATICSGQTFTLPWGAVVNTAGSYRDTTRFSAGCDSLIRTVELTVNQGLVESTTTSVCSGQSYTLPWGTMVNASGLYRDTLRTAAGCDSLVRAVDLTVKQLTFVNESPVVCPGQSYTLPWGAVASATGVYKDTLRFNSGCDSVIRTVNLLVRPLAMQLEQATICSGQNYILPWGTVVISSGIYRDTLRYASGCDSLVRELNLTVTPATATSSGSVILCAGQTHTLPWGTVVNTTGVYTDTLKNTVGCDSLIRLVDVLVRTTQVQSIDTAICTGQGYVLPSGQVVSASGTYRDTLHFSSGCDSMIRTVNLLVRSVTQLSQQASICSGSSYTLPWGAVVNTSGIYRDTLRYANGCDSVRREINLAVNAPALQSTAAVICSGETYTLPWGTSVSAAGIHRDTIRYASGCDSLVRIVDLSVRSSISQTINATICSGDGYTLPSGQVVSAAGIYRDTIHYAAGCDSLVRQVNLSVKTRSLQSSSAVICSGSSYTFPWGAVVSISGIYRDTLRYANGCDSVLREINLAVNAPAQQSINALICNGNSYTLPWGASVSAAGIYRDTLRYASGCDSLVRVVDLKVQSRSVSTLDAVICAGENYTLPWGAIVTTTGTYRDTLRYASGCDSLERRVNLRLQSATIISNSATICAGTSYTLPWGPVVNSTGIYRDTISYASGCDSIIRVVSLNVTAPATTHTTASICSDEMYTLPWGVVVNTTGLYRDTLRTAAGCDSLVRSVNLTVNQAPVISLSKSNDIDCMLGTAKLQATGGARYSWSPAHSLTASSIRNPIARPDSTTMYQVLVTTDKGCTATDSILVEVNRGDASRGYLVPSAFTPDGDGLNDCFGIKSWGQVTDVQFHIFNRWGQQVFYTSDPNRCWDGNWSGRQQRSEVFVYVIRAKTICGLVERKGTVTLVR